MNKSNNKSFNSPLHLILEVAHAHTALQETVVNAVAEVLIRNPVEHRRFVILLM
jgi:hypothetical protein